MKSQMAVMMTGVVLAMPATTLPAAAKQLHISTLDELGAQHQTQILATTGARMPQHKSSVDEQDVEESQLAPSQRAGNTTHFRNNRCKEDRPGKKCT
jgi:hypothetical protein